MLKKFWREFKEFALRGNVMNLAVGVIIGAAFQGVITSLTENILAPLIGLFTGRDFGSWYFTVFSVDIRYGAFITSVINFLIMAFVVFLLMKAMNRLLKLVPVEPPAAPTERDCPYCAVKISVKATRCPYCTSQLEC